MLQKNQKTKVIQKNQKFKVPQMSPKKQKFKVFQRIQHCKMTQRIIKMMSIAEEFLKNNSIYKMKLSLVNKNMQVS